MPLSEAEIAEVVRTARVVAVVGAKDDTRPHEPAHAVPARMAECGIRIVPVNPTLGRAFGTVALGRIEDLRERVDVVQVFRRPEHVPAIADAVLALPAALRPPVVWLQSGIAHEAAAARLEAAGVGVVMDRCFAVDLARARLSSVP